MKLFDWTGTEEGWTRFSGRCSSSAALFWLVGSDPSEALELQEVEGVNVPEHDSFDLVGAAHQQSLQAVVTHVSVGPLGGEASSVDGLCLLTDHALSPGDDAWSIVPSRHCRIALAVLGQGTEQLDLLGVQGSMSALL